MSVASEMDFSPGAKPRPVVTEVGVGGSCRDDEEVVADLAFVGLHDFAGDVDALNREHQHGHILLAAHDVAYRPGDVRRCKGRRRDLIEQGLEAMMIVAVEDEDARSGAGKRLRSRNPGEAAADDDDARFGARRRCCAA